MFLAHLSIALRSFTPPDGCLQLVASDGEQALNLLDNSIDLLLLDVMMPKKNGIDTLKELRQQHQTPVIDDGGLMLLTQFFQGVDTVFLRHHDIK